MEVCYDVKTEPELLPAGSEDVSRDRADKARWDISTIGVWNKYEKSFFDVRVTRPNTASHQKKSMDEL